MHTSCNLTQHSRSACRRCCGMACQPCPLLLHCRSPAMLNSLATPGPASHPAAQDMQSSASLSSTTPAAPASRLAQGAHKGCLVDRLALTSCARSWGRSFTAGPSGPAQPWRPWRPGRGPPWPPWTEPSSRGAPGRWHCHWRQCSGAPAGSLWMGHGRRRKGE